MSMILRVLLLLLPLPALAQNLPLPTTAPIHGKASALVTIVAVGDFQCPFCRRLSPNLARLEMEFPNDVRVMWLNLPLPFHPNANRLRFWQRQHKERDYFGRFTLNS